MKNTSKKRPISSLHFRFAIVCLITVISLFSIALIPNALSKTTSPKERTLDLGDGITMEFIRIDRGSFMMGSLEEEGDSDETPRHKVTITKPFYIGKYEVTQEQWKKVMGENPSEFVGDNYPVDSVSWRDCMLFTEKLSEITGKQIELPTEAQWEYACRAGTTTKWFYGSEETTAGQYGWIDSNSQGTSHPVGMKTPNSWGLYDMYGNLQEWCFDWYQNPYTDGESDNPSGPQTGDSRIIRGGGWGEFPDNARSAYRNANGEDVKNNGTGFRCMIYINK